MASSAGGWYPSEESRELRQGGAVVTSPDFNDGFGGYGYCRISAGGLLDLMNRRELEAGVKDLSQRARLALLLKGAASRHRKRYVIVGQVFSHKLSNRPAHVGWQACGLKRFHPGSRSRTRHRNPPIFGRPYRISHRKMSDRPDLRPGITSSCLNPVQRSLSPQGRRPAGRHGGPAAA